MTVLSEPGAAYQVCGITIAALNLEQAAQTLVQRSLSRGPLEVHLCNAYTLSLVKSDPELTAALHSSGLNLADGTPVAWLGRNHGMRGPVRGPDLMPAVVELGVRSQLSHYLYGGLPGVAGAAAAELRRRAPGVRFAGMESPPFHRLSDDELADLALRVRESKAHIVWVGIGTPAQDHLVPRLAEAAEVAVVPVGAAFDFLSGRVKVAPRFMHGKGLEWVHRLAHEPRRLWRRYLIGTPRFAALAIRRRDINLP